MKAMLKWGGLALVVLLAIAAYRLGGTLIGAKVEQQVGQGRPDTEPGRRPTARCPAT